MRRFLPFVVAMAILWVGCGGSKSSSTTTTTVFVTISPTTASIAGGATQQFTATVTGSTNTAVNWAVDGTPGGNATTGTITATGLYTAPTILPASTTQTITATSQADTTQIGTATVTLTAPTVTISICAPPTPTSSCPTSATVPAGGTVQFTPKVTSTDNNTAVTWSVNGCSVAIDCGTISSTGLYTAPLSPPREAITVTATSVSNPSFFVSAPITIQFGNGSLQGNYVFLVTQPDNASVGFALRAGTFNADGNGHITAGIEDSNSSAGVASNVAFTGTYSVGVDGRGTATINDTTAHSFRFVLSSNARGQLIEVDSGAASGFVRQQDQTAIGGVSGTFVFGLSGNNGGPAAGVGQISFANGNAVTGTEDVNSAGTLSQSALAGSFTIGPSGRGTVSFSVSNLGSNFAFYIINATTLALIDIDSSGARTAGPAFAQSTSAFTTASLNSSTYFVSGNAVPGSKPYAQAGRFDTDGISKLTGGIFDANNAGSLTPNSAFSNTASYTLSSAAPTNGRGTISTGTSNFIFWLALPQQGVILESDAGLVATGLLFQQQTGISSITGGYQFVVAGISSDGTIPQATDGQLTVAGFGVLSGTEDVIAGGAAQVDVVVSGSLLQATNDRSTGTIKGSTSVPYTFYLISADRFIMLSASSTSVLSGLGERQCSDCGF